MLVNVFYLYDRGSRGPQSRRIGYVYSASRGLLLGAGGGSYYEERRRDNSQL